MGGESKKLTAAEKGKAKMAEKEGKTKEQKDLEAAVNAAHAAELQMRGRGIRIRDNAPSATQTPESPVPLSHTVAAGMDTTGTPGSETNPARTLAPRKRTRADVDPDQETDLEIEDEDEDSNHELILESLCSVVTVATVMSLKNLEETIYGTGFILITEENYCLVFTSYLPFGGNYFVHFKDDRTKTKASMLTSAKNKFSILIVETVKKHAAIVFDDDPLDYETVYTVGAMAGSKLNAHAKAPLMEELEGGLGLYEGFVSTVTYDASDYKHKDLYGAEGYFQLICDVHDELSL